jgi:hypothetical protein
MAKRPSIVSVTCSVVTTRRNPYTLIKKMMRGIGMDAAREVIFEEGDFLASKLQLNILQQTIPMKPLSPGYADYKARHKPDPLDPRILIATGEYVNSIAARRKAGGDIVDVNVPDEKHESSGMNLRELGRLHEFGSKQHKETGKGVPPRPHWRPTIRWWKRKRLEATEKEIDKNVGDRVFRRLGSLASSKKYNVKPKRSK